MSAVSGVHHKSPILLGGESDSGAQQAKKKHTNIWDEYRAKSAAHHVNNVNPAYHATTGIQA